MFPFPKGVGDDGCGGRGYDRETNSLKWSGSFHGWVSELVTSSQYDVRGNGGIAMLWREVRERGGVGVRGMTNHSTSYKLTFILTSVLFSLLLFLPS